MVAGLRIKENKEVYEGEVTELTPEEAQSQTGGYGKVISHVVIGLKTVKGTKQLKLDPTIYDRSASAIKFSPFTQGKLPGRLEARSCLQTHSLGGAFNWHGSKYALPVVDMQGVCIFCNLHARRLQLRQLYL